MKIWNKLNLLVIGLIISILPTFATSNWIHINNQTYMDINSIRKESHFGSSYGNYYSVWTKNLSDESKTSLFLENYYKTKIWYYLSQHYYDCNNKSSAVKGGIIYDLKGDVIGSETVDDYNLTFHSIAPGTTGNAIYDYVCTGRF